MPWSVISILNVPFGLVSVVVAPEPGGPCAPVAPVDPVSPFAPLQMKLSPDAEDTFTPPAAQFESPAESVVVVTLTPSLPSTPFFPSLPLAPLQTKVMPLTAVTWSPPFVQWLSPAGSCAVVTLTPGTPCGPWMFQASGDSFFLQSATASTIRTPPSWFVHAWMTLDAACVWCVSA